MLTYASAVDPDHLVTIAEIERCKYRYLRTLDQKDWAGFADTLTVDAVADYSGGAHHFEGRETIVEFVKGALGDETILTSHRVHHPEIDLVGPDRAEGIWAMDDTVVLGPYDLVLTGAGFYDDTYRRDPDGVWRIAATGYRRTFEVTVPTASIDGFALTASWWGTDGRSTLG